MDKINQKTLLKVVLKEVRNRQIRKIAKLLVYPVQDLQRIAISNIESNGLQECRRRVLRIAEWTEILN